MSKDKKYIVWYEYTGTDPETLKDIEEDPFEYWDICAYEAPNLTELAKRLCNPADDNVMCIIDTSEAKRYEVVSTLKEKK